MNSTATDQIIPVELYGSLLDGHRAEVRLQDEMFNIYLFNFDWGGYLYRIAYKPAGRTTRKGKRWVLKFDCIVSKQKKTTPEA